MKGLIVLILVIECMQVLWSQCPVTLLGWPTQTTSCWSCRHKWIVNDWKCKTKSGPKQGSWGY